MAKKFFYDLLRSIPTYTEGPSDFKKILSGMIALHPKGKKVIMQMVFALFFKFLSNVRPPTPQQQLFSSYFQGDEIDGQTLNP